MEERAGKPAILYVEDEAETRGLIGNAILSEYPEIRVYTAANGHEGLKLFEEHPVDLVITDIAMPGMDGIAMANKIKTRDPDIELIALTAYSDTSFLINAIETGFSHYVMKPVDFDLMFAAIGKSLALIELKRQLTRQNDQIRQFAAELERKVDERTKELLESREELEKRNLKLRQVTFDLKAARDRYWNLYNWSPLGYLSLDQNFTIQEINITGAQIFGFKRAELLGKQIDQNLSPENMNLLRNAFDRCRKEKHAHVELQIEMDDHKYLYVQLHCEPYRELPADLKLYRAALVDVTKLKEAEDKLFRLNRLYSMLIMTGKAIVRSSNMDELSREISRIAVEEGGFEQACICLFDDNEQVDVAAKSSARCSSDGFVCFAEKLAEPCPVAAAIREKGFSVINDCLNEPNGGYAYNLGITCNFRSTAAFSLQVGGKTVGAFSIYSGEADYFDQQMVDLLTQMTADISFALESLDRERRRREAEEALRLETVEKLQALEDLRLKEQQLLQQNRLAAMGEMIGNIAHQWRQPLNLLALLVQELPLVYETGGFSQDFLEEETEKAMEVIAQMSGTIDDFRKFFEPDREVAEFEINQAVKRAVAFVTAAFKAHNVEVEIVEEAIVQVKGYPGQFSQVILNLLMNARDVLMERAVEDPKVVVHVSQEREKGVVTFSDNAGGIPDEIINKIFDPYFTTKGPDRGTGIGLFMSKTIIEKNMGGSLKASNAENGAEFRVEVKAV